MTTQTTEFRVVTGFTLERADDGSQLIYRQDGELSEKLTIEQGRNSDALFLVAVAFDGVDSSDMVIADMDGGDHRFGDIEMLDRAIAALTATRQELTRF